MGAAAGACRVVSLESPSWWRRRFHWVTADGDPTLRLCSGESFWNFLRPVHWSRAAGSCPQGHGPQNQLHSLAGEEKLIRQVSWHSIPKGKTWLKKKVL